MKKATLLISLGILGFVFSISSCSPENKRNEAVCQTVHITYDGHIKNIIDNHCIKCHDGANEFSLKTYSDVVRVKNDVIAEVMAYKMPVIDKGVGPLSEAQLDSINCWKLNNFPQN